MPRKLILVLAIFALLLGACGPVATPTPATAPAPTAAPTEIPPTIAAAEAATKAPTATLAALTFTDGLGREVKLAGPAQRIISLAPSNTEILFAIGAGKQVVGADDFSDYPPEAASLPKIGSLQKQNTEQIVALKPDLVLAAEINSQDQVKALTDLGLTVFYLSNPKTLEDMYTNLGIVANLTGHEQETAKLIDSLKSRVAIVDEKIKSSATKPVVFYELDSTDPAKPWTAGSGSFVDGLITRAGGINLTSAAGIKDAYPQVSVEQIVSTDPDLILLGDATWGGVTAESVGQRPGWEKLKAAASKQVYPFDDNTVSRPGPRLVDGLEALAKLLHPELFK
jgi:iron complex transport system substrate-binding protein